MTMEELECVLDKMFDEGKQYTDEYKALHKELIEMQCEAQWAEYESPTVSCELW